MLGSRKSEHLGAEDGEQDHHDGGVVGEEPDPQLVERSVSELPTTQGEFNHRHPLVPEIEASPTDYPDWILAIRLAIYSRQRGTTADLSGNTLPNGGW